MYEKILVPVDGSETSGRALEQAVKLAQLSHGHIRLIHILDTLLYANGFERPEIYVHQLLPSMLRAGHRVLADARHVLERHGVACDCHLEECDGRRVSEIIVDHARDWNADVIVMGTHGRRGINRLMMGSDAELVVRTAPVPVLLVRPPEREGEALPA
jgi:nucleotide-binding universal stress UspA family protein